MDQVTDRLPGIIAVQSGICINDRNTAEHEQHLLQLMKTASSHSLVFNSSKCSIHQSHISFYRAIFTAQGMKPNPTKVQVLKDLPTPKNQTKCDYAMQYIPGKEVVLADWLSRFPSCKHNALIEIHQNMQHKSIWLWPTKHHLRWHQERLCLCCNLLPDAQWMAQQSTRSAL